jgi:hypothetical protein
MSEPTDPAMDIRAQASGREVPPSPPGVVELRDSVRETTKVSEYIYMQRSRDLSHL